jgi:hypothetical protein
MIEPQQLSWGYYFRPIQTQIAAAASFGGRPTWLGNRRRSGLLERSAYELVANTSLVCEMRMIAFYNKLIEQGRLRGGKLMLVHVN